MLLFPVPVQITTHIMECNEKISHQVSLKNDIMICYSCPVQNALAYQQFVDTVNKKLINVIDIMEYHRNKKPMIQQHTSIVPVAFDFVQTHHMRIIKMAIFMILFICALAAWIASRNYTTQLGVGYSSNNAGDGLAVHLIDGKEYDLYSQEEVREIERKAKQGQKIVGTAFAAGAAYIAFTKS
jgi:hypothetical protein